MPDNEEDVWAAYEWSLTGKGTEQLEQRNIPLAFPAVVHQAGAQSDLFYFAGDFADTAHASPVHKYSGYAAARALVTPAALYPEQAFFWKTYVPLMKSVLSMEKREKQEAASRVPAAEKNGLSYTAKGTNLAREMKLSQKRNSPAGLQKKVAGVLNGNAEVPRTCSALYTKRLKQFCCML